MFSNCLLARHTARSNSAGHRHSPAEVRGRRTNKSRFISILLSIQPLNLASIELDPFLWESSYKSSTCSPLQQASGRAGRPAQSAPNAQPRSQALPREASSVMQLPTNLQCKQTEANATQNANIWADTGSTIAGRGVHRRPPKDEHDSHDRLTIDTR